MHLGLDLGPQLRSGADETGYAPFVQISRGSTRPPRLASA